MENNCLACNSGNLIKLLDFGPQPAANRLLNHASDPYDRVSLSLNGCPMCGHMQQNDFYSPVDLFTEYFYQSNTSNTLIKYFDWLASDVLLPMVKNNSRILEIASNDGSFIKSFRKANPLATFVGIDPAENLVNFALNNGVATLADFFPSKLLTGKFDLIVAQNVIAHTPNPYLMLLNIKEHLENRGIAYIQVSQAMMLENAEYDTLYHEHFSFFSDLSMNSLAERAGLKLQHVFITDIHGGSKGYFLTHPGTEIDFDNMSFKKQYLIRDYKYSHKELDYSNLFRSFSREVHERIDAIQFIHDKYANRKRVLVGVAAKSITVMQSAKIQYDYILDEAPLKIGKFVPGTSIPIKHISEVCNIEDDAVYFIGAWNFYDELREKLSQIKSKKVHTVAFFPEYKDDFK